MNENEVKDIAIAIAQALGLKKAEEVQLIISNMSKEGILTVYQILNSNLDQNLKLAAIQEVVKTDLLKTEAKKAKYGAKLNYIKFLRQGSTINTFRLNGDPGSVDSTRGMILNKKLKKMLLKDQSGGTIDKFNFVTYQPTKNYTYNPYGSWFNFLNYRSYPNSNYFNINDYILDLKSDNTTTEPSN